MTIEQKIEQAFGDKADLMLEVARCESTLRQFNASGTVLTGFVDSDDTGIFQINKRYHLKTATELGLDLDTEDGNIAYAKYLFDTQGTKPWNPSKKCWSGV